MSDDDDLSSASRGPEVRDEFGENGLGIEVLFGLIYNQRPPIVLVYCQVEKEEDDPSGAGGQLLNCYSIVFDRVQDLNVVRVIQPVCDLLGPDSFFRLDFKGWLRFPELSMELLSEIVPGRLDA